MFQVVYHPLVGSEDIPKLPSAWRKRVHGAIEQRLMSSPDLYGKPLRRSLRGYRKLRAGDYRVIFRIEKNTVKILIISHRSVVYSQIEKRL